MLQAGYDMRSIFKWSKADLNSDFAFSLTACLSKDKEDNVLYYLPIAAKRRDGLILFPRKFI